MDVYDSKGRIDIDYVMNRYVAFDEPVPYKNWKIYPISIRDYDDFIFSYDILDIDKNQVGDVEVIQMSYLEFLIKTIFEEMHEGDGRNVMSVKLASILSLCLGTDPTKPLKMTVDDKGIYYLIANETTISPMEFDEIRRIILHQNIIGYDENDKRVDPALRKAYAEYHKLNGGNLKEPSIDVQMARVQAHTGISKNELAQMTGRSFKLLLHSCIKEVDYIINKTGEMSGRVEFKKPIEHWIFEQGKKDKYAEAFVSYDGYMNKMSPVT